MTVIGYHASHEQFSPKELLEYVQLAERVGFGAAMCSDHFYPWSDAQGHSGFAWSWLGAAMQATSLPFGIVTVPGGWRYHPTIIAQAAATLNVMYPGRFWLSPGSGEALNEHIVGGEWPDKERRNARLKEGVEIMQALWRGETVTRHDLIPTEDAYLYTRPATPPLTLGAAVTVKTAAWLGTWSDGLMTVSKPLKELREMLQAFRDNGGEGKPVYVQAKLAYAKTEAEARQGAFEQWRVNIFDSPVLAQLRMPASFEAAAEFVRPEDVAESVQISVDLEQQTDWLAGLLELGIDHLYLHNVHCEQTRFIEDFGERVLPALKR